MLYLGNSFSLNMLGEGLIALTEDIPLEEAKNLLTDFGSCKRVGDDEGEHTGGGGRSLKVCVSSCIGHEDTAHIIGRILGVGYLGIPFRRKTISLQKGDVLIVGQYIGPRLPEGATKLPEGSDIHFFRVIIQYDDPRERISQLEKELAEIKRQDNYDCPVRTGYEVNPIERECQYISINCYPCGDKGCPLD